MTDKTCGTCKWSEPRQVLQGTLEEYTRYYCKNPESRMAYMSVLPDHVEEHCHHQPRKEDEDE